MKKIFVVLTCICLQSAFGQHAFTRKDSLHGGLRPERTSFDIQRYDLDIAVDTEQQSIIGFNDITFKVVQNTNKIQIDLFENMVIDRIVHNGANLTYKRDFNAVFVEFPSELQSGTTQKISFFYSGKPVAAKRAPWDGGFVWKKDKNGKPWVGVAVQGTGASLWYPCKDSQTDEPDLGATIKVTVPNGLMNVSNGRFIGSTNLNNGTTRWDWEVKNPINSYNITLNIGDYVHIHDNHQGLDLDYYVLRGNEQIATKHFEEVKPMMDCFQSKFGAYPFAQDGYKLVQTSYLGMEHQSAVAYGNKFLQGYLGSDLSGTGIGLLFDFITIHESGHEWFGNSVTAKDVADMWIHEGFTTYSETVFVECNFGYEKAMKYINGQRRNIQNDRPIIGSYGVQSEGSGDMYNKGALMINTMRHIVGNDEKWWAMLRKFAETYRHQMIDTETVLTFFNTESGMDFTKVFDQYLRTTKYPFLDLSVNGKQLTYQWKNCVDGFDMPVDIEVSSKKIRLHPTTKQQTLTLSKESLQQMNVFTDHFLIDLK